MVRLSFWQHPIIAEDPLFSKWCNAKFLQICSNEKKKIQLHFGWPGWVHFQQISICTISLTTAQFVCYSSFWRNCLVFCTCPVQTMTNPAWRRRCQGVPAHWGTSPRPRSTIVLNHAANWCLRSSLRDMAWLLAPLPKPVSPTWSAWHFKLTLWSYLKCYHSLMPLKESILHSVHIQ